MSTFAMLELPGSWRKVNLDKYKGKYRRWIDLLDAAQGGDGLSYIPGVGRRGYHGPRSNNLVSYRLFEDEEWL